MTVDQGQGAGTETIVLDNLNGGEEGLDVEGAGGQGVELKKPLKITYWKTDAYWNYRIVSQTWVPHQYEENYGFILRT